MLLYLTVISTFFDLNFQSPLGPSMLQPGRREIMEQEHRSNRLLSLDGPFAHL
jgi:hypothetical protein